jgi:hypothetical protein
MSSDNGKDDGPQWDRTQCTIAAAIADSPDATQQQVDQARAQLRQFC